MLKFPTVHRGNKIILSEPPNAHKYILNSKTFLGYRTVIFIQIECGERFSLITRENETILDIKSEIKKKVGTSNFKLMFKGAELEDGKTIRDYNIGTGDVLELRKLISKDFKSFCFENF